MLPGKEISTEQSPITVTNLLKKDGTEDQRAEIIAGLTAARRRISSKYFYDKAGGRLFEKITRLPEYYLTRRERSILKQIAGRFGPRLKDHDIIELGSGDCSKISILLQAIPHGDIESVRYIPLDVNRTCMEESSRLLLEKFPGLTIRGVVADFTRKLPPFSSTRKRVFCFFGSTIGNLNRRQVIRFLENVCGLMRPGDRLLLGADMVKDRQIIENAYNDRQGVTAEFNLNILRVVNRLIGTDFRTTDFEHVAFYDEEHSRIEMHLKAIRELEVSSIQQGLRFTLRQGETIHTENSHKFDDRRIRALAAAAGLRVRSKYTDRQGWFSIFELHPAV
jgi:L-histidine N-alpha-methyltransferase